MRTASIHEIKQELITLTTGQVTALCLRLARFKKENKELLNYLLFEANDEQHYINNIKEEIESLFAEINLSHIYFAKKTLRKILRVINKYTRYSGNKQTEIELRIFFCRNLKISGIPIRQNTAINNIFDGQLKKTDIVIATLHEDLQYDYRKEIAALVKD